MAGFGEYGAAASAALEQKWQDLLCILKAVRDAVKNSETASIGTARTLAYQYGMPPAVGSERLAPRSMTSLPLMFEGEVEGERVTLDVGKDHGRFIFAGYVANIGDVELKAAWVGVDGGSSGFFSLPPAATVQVPCILRGILLESSDGTAARYQVSAS